MPRACEIISRGPPRNPGFRGGAHKQLEELNIVCTKKEEDDGE